MLEFTPQLDPPLKARLQFSEGAAGATRIVDDRSLMARTFGYLFGFGALLALATLLLPGSPERNELAIAGVSALALVAAALFVGAYDRLPRWVFLGAPMFGSLLVALVLAAAGAEGTAAYALFYCWVALAAFYFFEL